jgi:RsiW-degrading membrane proteinase PrsW (M82 family)
MYRVDVLTPIALSWSRFPAASLPVAHDAVTGVVTGAIVVASVFLMVLRKTDPLWIVVGAALSTPVAAAVHIRSL